MWHCVGDEHISPEIESHGHGLDEDGDGDAVGLTSILSSPKVVFGSRLYGSTRIRCPAPFERVGASSMFIVGVFCTCIV